MPRITTERTNLLVIGGGIAGTAVALVAAADSDVVLLTKGPLEVWR